MVDVYRIYEKMASLNNRNANSNTELRLPKSTYIEIAVGKGIYILCSLFVFVIGIVILTPKIIAKV